MKQHTNAKAVDIYELVGVARGRNDGTQFSYETDNCPSSALFQNTVIRVQHIQPIPDINLVMGLPDYYIMQIDDDVKMSISAEYTDILLWKKVLPDANREDSKSND
jgi:hypothetical protein